MGSTFKSISTTGVASRLSGRSMFEVSTVLILNEAVLNEPASELPRCAKPSTLEAPEACLGVLSIPWKLLLLMPPAAGLRLGRVKLAAMSLMRLPAAGLRLGRVKLAAKDVAETLSDGSSFSCGRAIKRLARMRRRIASCNRRLPPRPGRLALASLGASAIRSRTALSAIGSSQRSSSAPCALARSSGTRVRSRFKKVSPASEMWANEASGYWMWWDSSGDAMRASLSSRFSGLK